MSEDISRGGYGGVESDGLRSDWSEHGTPSTTVVTAVAAARDVAAVDLPPLNDTVDPDALDRLVTDGDARVSFEYAQASVFVQSDGAVEVVLD
jgi:hypothetical protein